MNEEQTATDALNQTFQNVSAFGNPLPPAEGLKAVREAAALASAAGWVPIRITGPDAADYLHRRLAQSVKDLETGRGRQALQLSGDGRMECDLLLYRRGEEDFAALVDAPFAEAAAELLDKYVLMDEVEVRAGWADRATLTLIGLEAGEVIGSLMGDETRAACEADPWSLTSGQSGESALDLYRDGRWSTPCFQVVVPASALAEVAGRFDVAAQAAGGGVIGPDVQNYVRIDQAVTQFGVDTTVKTIPLEANLRPAIDLDKGCFPGQEFLARINNLGHPANVLARLRFDASEEVSTKDAIVDPEADGGPSGRVTSVQRLEGVGEGLALATLPWKLRGLKEAGVEGRGGRVKAAVELLGDYPDASAEKLTP